MKKLESRKAPYMEKLEFREKNFPCPVRPVLQPPLDPKLSNPVSSQTGCSIE